MERLQTSANETLAGIAAKAVKEQRYHLRHAAQWVVTLGDGTDESHARAQAALDDLWRYTGELFDPSGVGDDLVVDGSLLLPAWQEQVAAVVKRATLSLPGSVYMQGGGRHGRHTEHLGHMLAEMQIVARSNPGATW